MFNKRPDVNFVGTKSKESQFVRSLERCSINYQSKLLTNSSAFSRRLHVESDRADRVCLHVCNTMIFESLDLERLYLVCIGTALGNTGQVRILSAGASLNEASPNYNKTIGPSVE